MDSTPPIPMPSPVSPSSGVKITPEEREAILEACREVVKEEEAERAKEET